MEKNYLVRISYDGTNYKGFQIQKNYNSVESELGKALEILCKKKTKLFGSGRTDAGVHAYRQYFNFYSDLPFKPINILTALNSLLPDDIRVSKVMKVASDFHARYSATSKEYHYQISTKKYDVFNAKYRLELNRELDLTLMQTGANLFVGTHDFTNFTSNTLEEKNSLVREIFSVNVINKKGIVTIIFSGKGFLRYQVRLMVGALIHLGLHKITLEDISSRLNLKNNNKYPYKAPAHGLYLAEVKYA